MQHKRHTSKTDHSTAPNEHDHRAAGDAPSKAGLALLGALPSGATDGDPRHHGREHRAAEPRDRPRGYSGSTISWTITSYSLDLREPAPLRRPGGRSARTQAPLPDRPRHLHGLVACLPAMAASAGDALRGARRSRPRRGDALAGCPLDHHDGLPPALHRAKALAAWGAVGGAGAAIGVLVGGVRTEVADWRLIFYVNLPVAVALAVAAVKVIPRRRGSWPSWRGLDVTRRSCSATGEPCHSSLPSPRALVRGLGVDSDDLPRRWPAFAGLAIFAVNERHTETPLLPHRAAGRPCRRRRALPDAGGSRLDLRALPALLALSSERARHRPARTRVLRSSRWRSPQGSARMPSGHIVGASRCAPCHSPPRSRSERSERCLLAHVGANGTYLRNVLPGMLVAGFGLGIAVVSVSIAIMTGAR